MKSTKIFRYDLSGTQTAVYDSIRDFERITGICRKRARKLSLVNKAVSGTNLQLIQFSGNSSASTSQAKILADVVITNDSEHGRFILFDAPVNFK